MDNTTNREASTLSQPQNSKDFSNKKPDFGIVVAIAELPVETLLVTPSEETERIIQKLRVEVEKAPERYYFINNISITTIEVYIDRLISLNRCLVIDDLIYSCFIRELDENVLFWIQRLLDKRFFSRETLRHIVDSIVYIDTDGDDRCTFLKYKILGLAIKQYKVADSLVNDDPVSDEMGKGTVKRLASKIGLYSVGRDLIGREDKSARTELKDTLEILMRYPSGKDAGSDNVCVLANIIWEPTIGFLEMSVDTNEFEAGCILDMFRTIINCTGKFFQNRIGRKAQIFRRLSGLECFGSFIHAIETSFDEAKALIPQLKPGDNI